MTSGAFTVSLRCTACVAFALAAGAARPALAQDPLCPWGERREIGGHTFLYPVVVPSALITSYVGIRAAADVNEVPNFTLSGTGEVDIEQIHFAESVDAGVQLFDRLGLFASLEGTAATSTEVRSLVVRTGEYLVRGDAGAIVKLFRLPALGTQVSVRGSIGAGAGKLFTLLPLLLALQDEPRSVRDVLDGGLGELLLTPVSTVRWGAHVVAAQPLTPLFSLQAAIGLTSEDLTLEAFQLGAADRSDVELNVMRPEFGLAAAVDAAPLRVPVGAMLEYRLGLADEDNDTFDTSASATEHIAALGVYYTGRTDLQLGLIGFREWGSRTTSIRGPEGTTDTRADPRRSGGMLMLRYFW